MCSSFEIAEKYKNNKGLSRDRSNDLKGAGSPVQRPVGPSVQPTAGAHNDWWARLDPFLFFMATPGTGAALTTCLDNRD
jgi:hypothetical protein